MTPLLYAGGKIIIAKNFDATGSLDLIEQERCTVTLGVPTIFQMWLDTGAVTGRDFSHVRYFISGGAPCPVPLIHRWRETTGVALRQGYGMSEVGVNCFTMTNAESIARAGTVGKPIFHLDMQIVAENGDPVAVGETGELVIAGQQVCAGYLNNSEATASAIRDGWFHTGDMARRDAEGFYTIVGRFKDMIISGGENVYAAEVETAFLQHPTVHECALVGRPDEKWGEVGLLFVVCEPEAHGVSGAALLDFGRERLARYKVPKEIVFVEGLPHSAYGKVEKRKLKERYL